MRGSRGGTSQRNLLLLLLSSWGQRDIREQQQYCHKRRRRSRALDPRRPDSEWDRTRTVQTGTFANGTYYLTMRPPLPWYHLLDLFLMCAGAAIWIRLNTPSHPRRLHCDRKHCLVPLCVCKKWFWYREAGLKSCCLQKNTSLLGNVAAKAVFIHSIAE